MGRGRTHSNFFALALAVTCTLAATGRSDAASVSLPKDQVIYGIGTSKTVTMTSSLAQTGTTCTTDANCPAGYSCLLSASCLPPGGGSTGVCKELLQATDLTVDFASSVLSVSSVAKTTLTNSCSLDWNTTAPGKLTVALACPDGVCGTAGSGNLLSVQLTSAAAGTSPLNFSMCQFNEGSPTCSLSSTNNGNVTVSLCKLDVDLNGVPDVATDMTYIARRLLGLAPVPSAFRTGNPTIPSDAFIGANIDTVTPDLDVDYPEGGAKNGTDVATDITYISRRLLGLAPVPSSFRVGNPSIPSDAVIGARIDALCPR
jgi:hypothetical protein